MRTEIFTLKLQAAFNHDCEKNDEIPKIVTETQNNDRNFELCSILLSADEFNVRKHLPDYESLIDLLITRKRTGLVPGTLSAVNVTVVGWSETVSLAVAVLGAPGRQAINCNVVLQFGILGKQQPISKDS